MNLRTVESLPEQAARMFIVPMTLFSCASRDEVVRESTTSRVSITVSTRAAWTIRRRSACWAPTFTYSARSSSPSGSSAETQTIASMSGRSSSARATR